jgi:hypothetical protein
LLLLTLGPALLLPLLLLFLWRSLLCSASTTN